jgi:hypothetical protein
MSSFPVTASGPGTSLSLVSTSNQEHERACTKRAAELEAQIARLRAELQEAEAALEFERTRMPMPGDFVRCPLTSFFGRVTKVTSRPSGKHWIEIVPYLGPDLPGHSTMDLFDSWELIDPPSDAVDADGPQRLPTIAPFMAAAGSLFASPSEEDVEASLRRLWAAPNRISS